MCICRKCLKDKDINEFETISIDGNEVRNKKTCKACLSMQRAYYDKHKQKAPYSDIDRLISSIYEISRTLKEGLDRIESVLIIKNEFQNNTYLNK